MKHKTMKKQNKKKSIFKTFLIVVIFLFDFRNFSRPVAVI